MPPSSSSRDCEAGELDWAPSKGVKVNMSRKLLLTTSWQLAHVRYARETRRKRRLLSRKDCRGTCTCTCA